MPLHSPNNQQCEQIIKVLLHQPNAPSTVFGSYLRYYWHVCSRHDGYSSHEDILQVVTSLRENMNSTRSIFQERAFEACGVSAEHWEDCTRIAVQLAFMIDCSSGDRFSARYRLSNTLGRWQGDQPFKEFLESCFPTTASLCEKEWSNLLTASDLKKRYNVNFIAADDLAQHLVYDSRFNTVRIFHHTSWLKSQLRPWDQNFFNGFQHCIQRCVFGQLPSGTEYHCSLPG
jgi:hypothetical protein